MGAGRELVEELVALYNKQDWKAIESLFASDAVTST